MGKSFLKLYQNIYTGTTFLEHSKRLFTKDIEYYAVQQYPYFKI